MKRSVDLGTATSMQAAFNNGNGVWDNSNGGNHTIPAGVFTVKDKAVTADAADPCATPTPATGDTRVVSDGRLSVPALGKGNLRVHVPDLGGRNAAPGKIGAAGPYLK